MASLEDVLAVAMPRIEEDEGCELKAYPDAFTGAEPYTIGIGRADGTIKLGMTCTREEAIEWERQQITKIYEALDNYCSWFRNLDVVRAYVLINIGYNVGIEGLFKFNATLLAVKEGRYPDAACALLSSKAAKELPNRYTRLGEAMRTGKLPKV
jgi:GH24 family phage-related lysozyme (muramidase)